MRPEWHPDSHGFPVEMVWAYSVPREAAVRHAAGEGGHLVRPCSIRAAVTRTAKPVLALHPRERSGTSQEAFVRGPCAERTRDNAPCLGLCLAAARWTVGHPRVVRTVVPRNRRVVIASIPEARYSL